MTVLETSRLRLRHLALEDAAFMLELLNDPGFLRHIGDKKVRTLADAAAHIREGPIASYERLGFGVYLVELRADGRPVGICGLLKRDWLEDVDVGFAFLAPYRGAGYGFESASAVLGDARARLGLRRVLAIVNPENAASIGLLGRLGFAFERTATAPGEEKDVAVHAWEAR